MARVIIYDPGHASERALQDLASVHTPDYEARVGVDAVINPDTSGNVEPMKYWRHDTGTIRDMNTGEKSALDAEIQAAQIQARRDAAEAEADALSARGVRTRAVLQMSVLGDNITREWLTDFKAGVAGATNLNDFKTAVAALPNMPQWTKAQALSMFRDLVTSGDSDNG